MAKTLKILGAELETAWHDEIAQARAPAPVVEAAYARTRAIVLQIQARPASSLEELAVKARALRWCQRGETPQPQSTEERLLAGLVADLERIAPAAPQLRAVTSACL